MKLLFCSEKVPNLLKHRYVLATILLSVSSQVKRDKNQFLEIKVGSLHSRAMNQSFTLGIPAAISKPFMSREESRKAANFSYHFKIVFFLTQQLLGCCISLTVFQSSHEVDSDSFYSVFLVAV